VKTEKGSVVLGQEKRTHYEYFLSVGLLNHISVYRTDALYFKRSSFPAEQ